MLPSSQEALIEAQAAPSGEAALLSEAFANFIQASSRLELSYRDLQVEVAELSHTLSERNAALMASRSENEALGYRLQRILETIPCGVVVMGGDGAVQLANPEAARLLALSTGVGLGSDVETTPLPALRLELHTPMPAEDEGEQELSFEAAGGRVWVAVRRVPLPASAEALKGRSDTVLTVRDISARKQMEEEREAARDAVALAQVSALLAHEIRNPLASLELFAGLLEEDTERREEWLSHLRAGIRSLSGTVNNVLTLHCNSPLLLEAVDVLVEVGLAVDFLQPIARQVEVDLRFAPGETPRGTRIRGNRSAFHQILMNLCSNALRHTPSGGSVQVSCQAPGDAPGSELRISVVDTGCGIPADHMPHLFEAGFSGSGATSGLGLAVCDRLLRQMGGTLTVQSRVGNGSTFTLELPQQ